MHLRAWPGDQSDGGGDHKWRRRRLQSYARFNKQHLVASFSLFAEIHFQPSRSNCVLIWNYLCWLLSSGKEKWGILHLVVNDFILYFPGEHECAYKRSPLWVFQYLLHSCECFIWKKGIWVYRIKTLAFLHLQSNSGLKFPAPQRFRTIQTVACSLVRDCLCWIQI